MVKDNAKIISECESLLERTENIRVCAAQFPVSTPDMETLESMHLQLKQRIEFIGASIIKTALTSKADVKKAVLLFRDWMLQGAIVRVIGAGRARLAGSIPANRLAHGGARVYIQDDIIPMPHSIKGGGMIAVSASGKTQSVISMLKSVREKGRNIKIVGIADRNAKVFKENCDIFIGIDEDRERANPLQALADTGEYVISELLDAMVVAAGKLAGFDDTKWRIGHEDKGATGPYGIPVISDADVDSFDAPV